MKKLIKTEYKCLTCNEFIYLKSNDKRIPKYCNYECYWSSKDIKLKQKQKQNSKNSIVKYVKENGVWNRGLTKHTNKTLKRMSKERTGDKNPMSNVAPWNKGLTKKTDERIKNSSKKTKNTIIKMYATGDIDLTKRKIDYKLVAQKISDTVSRKISDGTLKNQHRYVKGIYICKNGNVEYYDSSYEHKRMKQLDEMDVKWTKKHKIRIKYIDRQKINRFYIPDFLINDNIIEEVKPASLVYSEYQNNDLKMKALNDYCSKKNIEYRIITEGELFNE